MALGQQITDLPDRPMTQPLIVGRSADADVQVPAVNVSRRHCLIFVHEGRWVLQDGGSSGGTQVNGQQITDSVYLNSGDVVILGSGEDAAQIVIDPFGQGVKAAAIVTPGVAGGAGTAKPGRAPSPTGMPSSLPQPPGMAAVPSPVIMPDYSTSPQPSIHLGGPTSSDEAEFDAAQFRREELPFPRPMMTPGMWAIGGVLALLIVVLGIWRLAYMAQNPEIENVPATPVNPQPVRKPTASDSGSMDDNSPGHTGGGSKIFKDPWLYGTVARAPEPRATQASADAASTQDTAPVITDPDFARVDDAYKGNTGNPQDQICIYADYLQTHPHSAFEADVLAHIDDALDRIWWKKIDKLVLDRQSVEDQLKKKKDDIAIETSDFKKTLLKEQTDLQNRLAGIQEDLANMNYLSQTRPNIDDTAQITELQGTRPRSHIL